MISAKLGRLLSHDLAEFGDFGRIRPRSDERSSEADWGFTWEVQLVLQQRIACPGNGRATLVLHPESPPPPCNFHPRASPDPPVVAWGHGCGRFGLHAAHIAGFTEAFLAPILLNSGVAGELHCEASAWVIPGNGRRLMCCRRVTGECLDWCRGKPFLCCSAFRPYG